jgi:hypothetical protein
LPPPLKVCGAASPEHFRSQVAVAQETEHEGPVQITWQTAPFPQETEPDAPKVITQVESSQLTLPLSPVLMVQWLPDLHSALQELEQVAAQRLFFGQLKDPLSPAWKLQLIPTLQVQLEPVQGQPEPGQGELGGAELQDRLQVRIRAAIAAGGKRIEPIVSGCPRLSTIRPDRHC